MASLTAATPLARTDGLPRRVSAVAVVAVLAAAAGLAFDGVFPLGALVPVVAVAAVAPAVLAFACVRLPIWASLAVSWAGWLVAMSATVYRSQAWLGFLPGPGSIRAAVLGVRDAGRGLLTTILPAAADSQLVVLAGFLVWAAAVAGAEFVLRTRAVVLPSIPSVLVLAVAIVLGVSGGSPRVPYAAIVVGLVLLLALVRSARSAGALVAGVPLLACLVAAAVVASPVLPMAARPYDVRDLVEQPPPKPIGGVSALDQVSAWLQNPQRQLFTVETSSEANLRLAVLDRFDGVTWTSSAGFVPTGGRVPGQDGVRETVEQKFTLQRLTGPWLPAADRPQQVNGTGLMVDPSTGMLASTTAAEGTTYRVASGIRRYSAEELRDAGPAGDPALLALPNGPEGHTPRQLARLRQIAAKATSGATSGVQQAVRLAAWLRKHAVNDVNAPPGHGYRSIEFFLLEARKGTTEQFAASFALLARSLGLPSRIVVGFRQGRPPDGQKARQVLAGDVLAWGEVEFAGVGWVPFYPTPSRSRSGDGGDVAEGASKQEQAIEQAIATATSKPKPKPTPTKPTPDATPRPESARGSIDWLPPTAITVAAVLAAYLLAVLVLPPLRRARRRRANVPAARVTGAWRQTTVRLRAAGIPAASDVLTAGEVALLGESALGEPAREPLTALADLANLAGFGGAPVDQADADLAWRHFASVDGLVRRQVALPRRLAHRLAPGSLVR